MYNRTNLSGGKLLSVDGTTDSQLLGSDVTLLGTTKFLDKFYIGSSSGGAIQNRYNYANILRLI